MKISKHWNYDYASKCDCADDDNCGCSYPENMSRTYTKNAAAEETAATHIKTNDDK